MSPPVKLNFYQRMPRHWRGRYYLRCFQPPSLTLSAEKGDRREKSRNETTTRVELTKDHSFAVSIVMYRDLIYRNGAANHYTIPPLYLFRGII